MWKSRFTDAQLIGVLHEWDATAQFADLVPHPPQRQSSERTRSSNLSHAAHVCLPRNRDGRQPCQREAKWRQVPDCSCIVEYVLQFTVSKSVAENPAGNSCCSSSANPVPIAAGLSASAETSAACRSVSNV